MLESISARVPHWRASGFQIGSPQPTEGRIFHAMFTIRSARSRGDDDGWNLSDDHPIAQKVWVTQPMEVSVSSLSVFF